MLRLGLDIGTNSIGWCIVRLGPSGLPEAFVDAGVRIFSDGRDARTGASLAADRQNARGQRRRRDRYLARRTALLATLVRAGLMPECDRDRKALERLDPLALRSAALDGPLSAHQLGRALFHLNQRRGFRCNRKADRGRNDEKGKIRLGTARLREQMTAAGARTLGEFLAERAARGETVRTRLRPDPGENPRGDGYDFYPDRALVAEELHTIWRVQRTHHPGVLTDALLGQLHRIIIEQRPLRKPEVGRCLYVDEPRLAKAHPLFQERRLYETVNALRIERTGETPRRLTPSERDVLILRLRDRRSATLASLARALRLDYPDERFTLETENRTTVPGDETRAAFAKTALARRYGSLAPEEREALLLRLLDEEDEHALLEWLMSTFRLTNEEAQAIADAPLPDGYGRIGETASRRILVALKEPDPLTEQVRTYDETVAASELHHSDRRTCEILDELPYYAEPLARHVLPGTQAPDDPLEKRLGRLTNPTVHVGLNQLRRVVNAIIRRYGKPDQIVVELARELKMSERQKAETNRRIGETTRAAEARSKCLEELEQTDNGANRLLLRLWEELNPKNPLDRRCVFTGQNIGLTKLLSDAVEIDHILPFSKTFDDSPANKIVCLREANRRKRNRAPFDAFGGDEDWPDIAERASRLPANKRWRFAPDAMTRFDAEGGFEARQLVDTQYLARLAREYLASVVDKPTAERGSMSNVWVTPGRLTEMLRRHWGLNEGVLHDHNYAATAKAKNRLDHRHHAIDAAVVAVTDRALLNRISREAARRELEGAERLLADFPEPWDGFRDELRKRLRSVTVSHKADHGKIDVGGRARGRDATAGRLHNDTAYGSTRETNDKGKPLVVHRVPLASLKTENDLRRVRDRDVRARLLAATSGRSGKAFAEALARAAQQRPLEGMRRVRVLEQLSLLPIRDGSGRPYKGYKGDANFRYDVWELPDGTWRAEVVSMFEAHQAGWESALKRSFPAARKVLRLHQNDLLAIEREGDEPRIVRVVKFTRNGQITIAGHQEAGDLKRRDADPDDPFKYFAPTAGGLKAARARQVRVDEFGRVSDPGPRA